jgi:hypothetical protein
MKGTVHLKIQIRTRLEVEVEYSTRTPKIQYFTIKCEISFFLRMFCKSQFSKKKLQKKLRKIYFFLSFVNTRHEAVFLVVCNPPINELSTT